MPRIAIDNERMNLRVRPDAKARLLRAASFRHMDLTNFVMQSALREADAVIADAEKLVVSEREFRRILDLLDNPPPLTDKMRAAVAALPKFEE